MNSSIRTIFHPTDFSDLSDVAFAHALRIALPGEKQNCSSCILSN
jgi:hypothetical protein